MCKPTTVQFESKITFLALMVFNGLYVTTLSQLEHFRKVTILMLSTSSLYRYLQESNSTYSVYKFNVLISTHVLLFC